MLPLNELAATAFPSTFNYPVKSAMPVDVQQGWEYGASGLNNITGGLLFQIWHCTLEIDADNVGYVYVEAPSVAKTLLFSGIGITAVDIAFDQNMNPFVAYKQLGLWKYYWYDPIALSMIHTTLVGARDLRCCLDDHRAFNTSDSDILLCYINAANELCVRYQRDRYAIEYILKPDIPENLVYVGMNIENAVQFGFGYLNG